MNEALRRYHEAVRQRSALCSMDRLGSRCVGRKLVESRYGQARSRNTLRPWQDTISRRRKPMLTDKERMELLNLRKRVQAQREEITGCGRKSMC